MNGGDGRASSRRRFLEAAAAAAAGTSLPSLLRAQPGERAARPQDDLSVFDTPISPRPFALRLGYHAITWKGQDEQAIGEIAALGFRGVQLRSNVVETYGGAPERLRARLAEKGLALLCFSSGSVDAHPEREREYLDTHLKHARFVKALGGSLLQLTSRRPPDRAPTTAEFAQLGRLLTEIGRRTIDLGVRVAYHNHMNAFGEAPEEVARVLESCDRHFVDFLLDIAHYRQGGGDPVAAVARHKERLALLHLKDVVSPLPGDSRPARQSYKFVELGRGMVDVPGVITALKKARFRGPAIIELDEVPDPARTPRESAEINKKYALETLGLSL